MSESLEALRRANPRTDAEFVQEVDLAAGAVRARIEPGLAAGPRPARRPSLRPRLLRLSATVAVAAGAAVATFSVVGPDGGGPGVENAAAAVRKAATLTAASAERSGTAVVRMTHGGEPWAGKTIRWNGADIAVAEDASAARPGRRELRVVDGTLYAPYPEGGWLELGSPASIDPESGTTPAEYLAAVREDVGGATLRRIAGRMSGLTAEGRDDGSTVYRGAVAAGLIAREKGFKEGKTIRVLPFGYVAHGAAADPTALLAAAITVENGVVRELAVTWGTWTYSVQYSGLGSTPPPAAPRNARSLLRERGLG